MPLKLNVGLSKKIGQPDYGSLGASCNLEVELDAGLLQNDLDGFHERVQRAYAACRQAVSDELTRQQNGHDQPKVQNGYSRRESQPTNGSVPSNGQSNGRRTTSGGHATSKQLDYAEQLAKQIRGLGKRGLEQLAQKMFDKPVADLSAMDASNLIDTLKSIKSGDINVDQALSGAAA